MSEKPKMNWRSEPQGTSKAKRRASSFYRSISGKRLNEENVSLRDG